MGSAMGHTSNMCGCTDAFGFDASAETIMRMKGLRPWNSKDLIRDNLRRQSDLAARSPLQDIHVEDGLKYVSSSDQKGYFNTLSREQFVRILESLLHDRGHNVDPEDTRLLYEIFDSMDFDRNGTLDVGEWAGGLSVFFSGTQEEGVAAVFQTIDQNHDGVLTHVELQEYLKPFVKAMSPTEADALRPLLTKRAVDGIYLDLDATHQQKVSCEDMIDWVRQGNNIIDALSDIIDKQVYRIYIRSKGGDANYDERRYDQYNRNDRRRGPGTDYDDRGDTGGMYGTRSYDRDHYDHRDIHDPRYEGGNGYDARSRSNGGVSGWFGGLFGGGGSTLYKDPHDRHGGHDRYGGHDPYAGDPYDDRLGYKGAHHGAYDAYGSTSSPTGGISGWFSNLFGGGDRDRYRGRGPDPYHGDRYGDRYVRDPYDRVPYATPATGTSSGDHRSRDMRDMRGRDRDYRDRDRDRDLHDSDRDHYDRDRHHGRGTDYHDDHTPPKYSTTNRGVDHYESPRANFGRGNDHYVEPMSPGTRRGVTKESVSSRGTHLLGHDDGAQHSLHLNRNRFASTTSDASHDSRYGGGDYDLGHPQSRSSPSYR